MTSSALIMLIVSIVMIWGGLGLAILNLMRHPEPTEHASEIDEYDPLAD